MYFALLTANQSKCVKYKVGAVAVKDARIICQGYNGSPSGFENCSDKFFGQDLSDPNVRKSHREWSKSYEIHAEMNILAYCARKGISLEGSMFYVTHKPCDNCLKHLIQAGVSEVIYLFDFPTKTDNDYVADFSGFIKVTKHEQVQNI